MDANKLYGDVMNIEQKIKSLQQNANFLSHGYNYHVPSEDEVNQMLLERLDDIKKIKEYTTEYIDTYNFLKSQICDMDDETENVIEYIKENFGTNPEYCEIVENLISSINPIEISVMEKEDNKEDGESSSITNVNKYLTMKDEEDSPTVDSSNITEDFSIKTPQKSFVNVFIAKSDSSVNQPMDTPAIKSSKAKRINF